MTTSATEDTTDPRILASRKWWLTIFLHARPTCPGCAGSLLANHVTVVRDIAWCPRCADNAVEAMAPWLRGLRSRAPAGEVQSSHGILFWTPAPAVDSPDVLIRGLELMREQRASRSPITEAEATTMYDRIVAPESVAGGSHDFV